MGGKNRKNEDGNLRKKRRVKRKGFNENNKDNTVNDLQNELSRLSEQKRINPSSMIKNKAKRKELVMQRNATKKKIKSKLRRKKQEIREEFGEDALPKAETRTIDNQREHDFTYVEEKDLEFEKVKTIDEFSDYFDGRTEPQILITTSISFTATIFKFVKALKDCIPNSYFYYRKKYDLKDIIEQAKEKGFTDLIVVYERLRKPYRMMICHLPNGPTMEFKLSNVIYHDQIKNAGKYYINVKQRCKLSVTQS